MTANFEMFNDIEDAALRTRNRAVVLTNLYADHAKEGKLQPRDAARILQYFAQIPEAERNGVQAAFIEQMKQRGYALQG